MFFKKKETATVAHRSNVQTQNAPNHPASSASLVAEKEASAPVYQKLVLRRYDQIDQVKPYGPSEI